MSDNLALDKGTLAFTLRIGLPAGVQGSLFSISNMIIWIHTIFVRLHSPQVLMLVYPVSWTFLGIAMMTAYLRVLRREA